MNMTIAITLVFCFVWVWEFILFEIYKISLLKHAIISFIIGGVVGTILMSSYIGLKNYHKLSLLTLVLFSLLISIVYEGLHILYLKMFSDLKFTFSKKKMWLLYAMGILLVSLFLEIVVFNYKFLVTRNNSDNSRNYFLGSGLRYAGNNDYEVVSFKDCFIRFSGFSEEINSTYLNVDRHGKSDNKKKATEVVYYATDAANANVLKLGTRNVIGSVKSSQYAILHLKGKSNEVTMELKADVGDIITINDARLNPVIPININYWRLLVVIVILAILVVFNPKSSIYAWKLSRKSRLQWIIVALFVIIESVLFGRFVMANTAYVDMKWSHHNQYQELAQAMAHGHFYLDEEPTDTLKNMENPYDSKARDIAMSKNGDTFLWDHAYYDGKYYVYFGVVPELVFYLPYYLITHENFKTVWGIIICGIIFIAGISQLIRIIIERWFKKTSFSLYLIITAVVTNSSGLLYIMAHPDFYDMPIIMGMMFVVWGLYFWISALKEDLINGIYLFFGAICMALVAGCRPQLLLISFIAFPLFMRSIVKKRLLFSRKTILKTISAFVPYVVVAAFIMYYNQSRFGSPFDFGANYNLTTNDMTNRFASLQLCLMGTFMYLFQPANIGMQFPFLYSTTMDISYLGNNIYETMYGGLITCNPILFLGVKLKNVIKLLKEKRILWSCVFLIILGISLPAFDVIFGGILPRYILDFALFLFLGVAFIILALNEQYENEDIHKLFFWRKMLICLSIITIMYNFIMVFANRGNFLDTANAKLYYSFCYGIQFWL